jgi:putative NADH-flavin reductase
MGETALVKVGLLHPGEMGAAIGAVLRARGHDVFWVSRGRSGATAERAEQAGLVDAADIQELCRGCDVLISVCPPSTLPAQQPDSPASTSMPTLFHPRRLEKSAPFSTASWTAASWARRRASRA